MIPIRTKTEKAGRAAACCVQMERETTKKQIEAVYDFDVCNLEGQLASEETVKAPRIVSEIAPEGPLKFN